MRRCEDGAVLEGMVFGYEWAIFERENFESAPSGRDRPIGYAFNDSADARQIPDGCVSKQRACDSGGWTRKVYASCPRFLGAICTKLIHINETMVYQLSIIILNSKQQFKQNLSIHLLLQKIPGMTLYGTIEQYCFQYVPYFAAHLRSSRTDRSNNSIVKKMT